MPLVNYYDDSGPPTTTTNTTTKPDRNSDRRIIYFRRSQLYISCFRDDEKSDGGAEVAFLWLLGAPIGFRTERPYARAYMRGSAIGLPWSTNRFRREGRTSNRLGNWSGAFFYPIAHLRAIRPYRPQAHIQKSLHQPIHRNPNGNGCPTPRMGGCARSRYYSENRRGRISSL